MWKLIAYKFWGKNSSTDLLSYYPPVHNSGSYTTTLVLSRLPSLSENNQLFYTQNVTIIYLWQITGEFNSGWQFWKVIWVPLIQNSDYKFLPQMWVLWVIINDKWAHALCQPPVNTFKGVLCSAICFMRTTSKLCKYNNTTFQWVSAVSKTLCYLTE